MPRLLILVSLLLLHCGRAEGQPTNPAAPTVPAASAPAAQPPAATAPANPPPAKPTAAQPEAAKPQPTRAAASEATSTPAAPATVDPASERNPLLNFLFFSWTGWILIACYLAFVTLLVLLTLDLRSGRFMPLALVDDLEDCLNKRRFKEGLDLAKDDDSLFAKVMAAGITRLQYGLPEARDAGAAMLENVKARKDALLSYVAILGTLGPLIGLVGTVAGMITTFAELGRGGTPRFDKLALGISHALNATLVGIFLSVLAIPVYSYFKNRLLRLILDADLLADDLLTQAFFASKREAAASSATAPAPKPPGREE